MMFILMSSAYAVSELSWYKFDGDFLDSGEKGNHLSCSGSCSFSFTQFFEGNGSMAVGQGNYAYINNATLLTGNIARTVSIRMKTTDKSYGDGSLWSISKFTSVRRGYQLVYDRINDNKFVLTAYSDNPELTGFLTLNEWKQYVIVYYGNTSLSLYIDGVLQSSSQFTDVLDTEEGWISVNSDYQNNVGVSAYYDDFRVFNFSMTDAQILCLNSTLESFDICLNPVQPTPPTITPCGFNITLGTTIVNQTFNWNEANGLNYTFYLNAFPHFTESLSFTENMSKISYPHGIYPYYVEAFNTYGMNTSSTCYMNVCVNNYATVSTPCVAGSQLLTYSDTHSCAYKLDFPVDNGTYVACAELPTAITIDSKSFLNTLTEIDILFWIIIAILLYLPFYMNDDRYMTLYLFASIIVAGYGLYVGNKLLRIFIDDTFFVYSLQMLIYIIAGVFLVLGILYSSKTILDLMYGTDRGKKKD